MTIHYVMALSGLLNRKRKNAMLRLLAAAFVLAGLLPLPAAAQGTQPWTQVRSLMCNPTVGFAGHQPMQCTYTPSLAAAPPQDYDGAINTVGLDIGINGGSILEWGVFAPTTGVASGALTGEYVGASGEGLGIGAGANILVGGSAAPSPCSRFRCKARLPSMSSWACRR